MATVPEMIKFLKKEHFLTFTEIGAKCEVSESCVSRWHSGDRPSPRMKSLKKLTNVYRGYKSTAPPLLSVDVAE